MRHYKSVSPLVNLLSDKLEYQSDGVSQRLRRMSFKNKLGMVVLNEIFDNDG